MKNKQLYSQILSLFPEKLFSKLVSKHKSDYQCKGFTSWSHFCSMLYGQLSGANSLSEIVQPLQSNEELLSDLGIHKPKKSTLAYANSNRSWQLYESLFYELLEFVLSQLPRKKHQFKMPLYSVDSTTIDLSLTQFDWASFRKEKGAVKLHVSLENTHNLPYFTLITTGKCADVKALWEMPIEANSITVFDRAYNDYALYYTIHTEEAYFVSRLKSNAKYEVIEELKITGKGEITKDRIVQFTGRDSKEKYPEPVRIIHFEDRELERSFVFVTNNFELSAEEVAEVYKQRWKIELFFKEIKQNLIIKKFVGTSENAVKLQVWIALIASLLLKLLHAKTPEKLYFSNIVALIRTHLFTQKKLWKWLKISKPQWILQTPS